MEKDQKEVTETKVEATEVVAAEAQAEAPVSTEALPAEAQTKPKRKTASAETPTKASRLRKAAATITLRDIAEQYLKSLEEDGKSEGTLFSYRLELRTALNAFGEDTLLAKLTTKRVAEFFTSDKVVKTRTGVQKSPLSIDKTRRVVRQMLEHAVDAGLVERAPLPADPAKA